MATLGLIDQPCLYSRGPWLAGPPSQGCGDGARSALGRVVLPKLTKLNYLIIITIGIIIRKITVIII